MGMGVQTLDMMLWLVGLGYTVKFSKAEDFRPATVLKIELSKGDNHRVEIVDISNRMLNLAHVTVDDIIAKGLRKAEFEFRHDFEKER